jgi:hypothetical protein
MAFSIFHAGNLLRLSSPIGKAVETNRFAGKTREFSNHRLENWTEAARRLPNPLMTHRPTSRQRAAWS